jgi:nuclear transport factor 2 (NTF2) superfamily protein
MTETIDNIYSRQEWRFEIRYHYGYKDDGTSNYKSVYGNADCKSENNKNSYIPSIRIFR